jgi:hypothetical protein
MAAKAHRPAGSPVTPRQMHRVSGEKFPSDSPGNDRHSHPVRYPPTKRLSSLKYVPNDKKIAGGRLERTIPIQFTIGEGLHIGMDVGSAVDFTYALPFAFTGKIEKVTVELKPAASRWRSIRFVSDSYRAAISGRSMTASDPKPP